MRPTLKAWRVFPTVLGALLRTVSTSAAEPTPKHAEIDVRGRPDGLVFAVRR
ncbi:hypothetical protein EJ065_0926 [Corallococcus coralloides]|uniref:Uncharacterized protein n=1 Tax=Corallococcus coralloides TaxID=184914 RepID=A0A410RKU6_CORCK|nr:hypothetical protein EJ065_0926 [Corallococcus coralloides]